MEPTQQATPLSPLARPQTLREATVSILRDAILEGRYLPGQKIVETQVAAELGISRAPLREAASTLMDEGLLVKKPFSGYSIPALSTKMVESLYATRTALETFAVEQCWNRRDAAFRDTLDQRHRDLLDATRERRQAAAIKAELMLHGTLYEWSDNELLQDFWRKTQGQLQIYWSAHQRIHDRYGPLEDAHEAYVTLAKGDDKQAMLNEIRDHMQRGLNRLRDYVGAIDKTGLKGR